MNYSNELSIKQYKIINFVVGFCFQPCFELHNALASFQQPQLHTEYSNYQLSTKFSHKQTKNVVPMNRESITDLEQD